MLDILGDFKDYLVRKNPNAVSHLNVNRSVIIEMPKKYFDVEKQMGIKKEKCSTENDEFMKDIMIHLDSIQSDINRMQIVIGEIKSLKRQAIQATFPEQEKAISKQLNELLASSNKDLLSIKKKLQSLKEANEKFAETGNDTAELKMRENLHAVVTQKFKEMLYEYQSLQTSFKKHVREKVTRQLKIVFPEASDAQVQEMLDEGEVSTASLIQTQITGQTHESLRSALSDIQYKYNDIRRLEKNVEELHQMFVDLAVLVEAQSEMMNQIEYSVTSAKDYTEKAEKDLVQARRNQRKAKRRIMCLGTCCIITIVIISIPIVITISR